MQGGNGALESSACKSRSCFPILASVEVKVTCYHYGVSTLFARGIGQNFIHLGKTQFIATAAFQMKIVNHKFVSG